MSLYIMIGLIGLMYIVIFGGMALMRREGLSTRFAVESLFITAIAVLMVVFAGISIHPAIFLVLLYIITLRVRLLVDLANFYARRGSYAQANRIYDFASHIWPDPTSKLIILVNQATLHIQENRLTEAIALFKDILDPKNHSALGVKYECAAHFNLGVAYLRSDSHSLATVEFNAAIDTWPGSVYAQRSQQALARLRNKEVVPSTDNPADQ